MVQTKLIYLNLQSLAGYKPNSPANQVVPQPEPSDHTVPMYWKTLFKGAQPRGLLQASDTAWQQVEINDVLPCWYALKSGY